MPIVVVTAPRRVRNPIPARYIDAITSACVFLINISSQAWVIGRTYGNYSIPGCQPGQKFTSTPIHGRIETMDVGDQTSTQQLTEAGDIAADLAGHCNEGILTEEGSESFMGVFVSDSKTPPAALLAEMQERLNAFYDGQIRLADLFHDDPHGHKNISGLHRRAAKIRNQTRPWTYEPTNMISCPACGSNVKAGVSVCRECGAVIDEEKARKHFPERFAAESTEATDARLQQLADKNKRK